MAFLKEDELRDALLLVYANKMDLPHALSGDGAGGQVGRAEKQKMASAAGQRSVWGRSDGGTGLGQSNAQDKEKVRKCLESSCPLCHSSMSCVSYTNALS